MIAGPRRFGLAIRLALGLVLLPAAARGADFEPQVWLNPGFFSYHFSRNPELREDNVGLGAEVAVSPDHVLTAGTFINSDRQRSRYGAYQWRPWHWQPANISVSAGVAITALDGYPGERNGGWFLGALPMLAIEGDRLGANIFVAPTDNRLIGLIALQIKLRVW